MTVVRTIARYGAAVTIASDRAGGTSAKNKCFFFWRFSIATIRPKFKKFARLGYMVQVGSQKYRSMVFFKFTFSL
jgi:hypothetical protein